MGENNEYYADKMRRLLENEGRKDRLGLGSAAGEGYNDPEDEPGFDDGEDFLFDDNKRYREDDKPKSFEEKFQRVKEAEAEAVRRSRKHSPKEIIITVALLCATLSLALFCVYKLFFVISSVTVEGNERYTAEQILASAGIETGANLYSFSSRVAEDNIKMYCPEVESIQVKRTPPGKIVVRVVEEKPYFYADFHGEIRALTADLRILGSVSAEECEKLVELKLPTVGRAVAGERVVFRDGEMKYAFEVSVAVAESALCEKMNKVDLRDSHNIRMVCDGKYLLKLEEYKDSEAKLKIAEKILENEIFNNSNKASIDLSQLSETGVIIDNQLDLDW